MSVESSVPKEMADAINKLAETSVKPDLDMSLSQVVTPEQPELISSITLSKRARPPLRFWIHRHFLISPEHSIPMDKLQHYFKKFVKNAPAQEYASVNQVLFTNLASAATGAKGLLVYFKSETDSLPLGIINLRDMERVKVVEGVSKPTLELVMKDRIMQFRTTSYASLNSFLETIGKVKETLAEDTIPESEEFKAWIEKLEKKENVFAPVVDKEIPIVEEPISKEEAPQEDIPETEPEKEAETACQTECEAKKKNRKSFMAMLFHKKECCKKKSTEVPEEITEEIPVIEEAGTSKDQEEQVPEEIAEAAVEEPIEEVVEEMKTSEEPVVLEETTEPIVEQDETEVKEEEMATEAQPRETKNPLDEIKQLFRRSFFGKKLKETEDIVEVPKEVIEESAAPEEVHEPEIVETAEENKEEIPEVLIEEKKSTESESGLKRALTSLFSRMKHGKEPAKEEVIAVAEEAVAEEEPAESKVADSAIEVQEPELTLEEPKKEEEATKELEMEDNKEVEPVLEETETEPPTIKKKLSKIFQSGVEAIEEHFHKEEETSAEAPKEETKEEAKEQTSTEEIVSEVVEVVEAIKTEIIEPEKKPRRQNTIKKAFDKVFKRFAMETKVTEEKVKTIQDIATAVPLPEETDDELAEAPVTPVKEAEEVKEE